MKVHVAKKTLAEALAHVERIVPARSSNPSLSLLRISTSADVVEMVGSNMDSDIRARIPADVGANGSFAVNAAVFAQVVRVLPADDVTLEFGDNDLEIVSGNYGTKLQLSAPSSAPEPTFPDAYPGEADASALSHALASVKYAAAVADFQAVFRGVKLEFSDSRTRAVASDGFRLAYFDLGGPTGLDEGVIAPARSIEELIKLLGDGPVKLALAEGRLCVQHGNYALNMKLMEGAFPDYQRVIPTVFPVSIQVKAAALSEAVNRVALMADKTSNNRVDLFIKEGTLRVTAEGSFGHSQEELQVSQEGTDSEIRLAYNAKYLTESLGPVAGEALVRFSGSNSSPSVITDAADPSYLAMVVPLRNA